VGDARAVALEGGTLRAATEEGLFLVRRPSGEYVLLGDGAPAATFPLEARAMPWPWRRAARRSPSAPTAGDLVVWWPSLDAVAQVPAHERAVGAVAFSDDGALLVSARGINGHEVRLWQVGEGRLSAGATVAAAGGPVSALAFGPGGTLWAGGDDRTLVGYAVPELRERHRIVGAPEQVQAVAVSPDGGTVAALHDGGLLVLWSVADGAARCSIRYRWLVPAPQARSPWRSPATARPWRRRWARGSWCSRPGGIVGLGCVRSGRPGSDPTEWAIAARPGDVRPCR
jgi:hypothetical protein